MQTFKIAHILEQGQNIIIIPLDGSFGSKTNIQKNAAKDALQLCATSARLAGTVVPVWDAGFGRMGFLAPQQWHSYFSNMDLSFVYANINKELKCNNI